MYPLAGGRWQGVPAHPRACQARYIIYYYYIIIIILLYIITIAVISPCRRPLTRCPGTSTGLPSTIYYILLLLYIITIAVISPCRRPLTRCPGTSTGSPSTMAWCPSSSTHRAASGAPTPPSPSGPGGTPTTSTSSNSGCRGEKRKNGEQSVEWGSGLGL